MGARSESSHREDVSQLERLAELSAFCDRLDADVASLHSLIGDLALEAAADQRQIARYDLGEVWGATKLALHLGTARTTAYRVLRGELAGVTWEDPEGRLRVNASDVERILVERSKAA